MKPSNTLTDITILKELGKRLAHARIASSLTQAQLADQAAVGKRTLERIESGESVQLISLIRVLRALNLLATFDAILPQAEAGPMEMLERREKLRRRVSSSRKKNSSRSADTSWHWGDEP